MPRLRLLAALALVPAAHAAADSIRPAGAGDGPVPPPNTWAVSSRNGEFIFVMRGATPDEPSHPHLKEKAREWSRELRATYPVSGLYDPLTGELIWATDERLEARSGWQQHHVIVTPTGVVVWLSHQPVGPRPAPADKAAWWGPLGNRTPVRRSGSGGAYSESKDGLAVRIIANGKTVGTSTAELLIADPKSLDAEPALGYTPWLSAVEVAGETLVLTTLDDQRITYDLITGEELDRRSLHGSSLPRWGLIIGAVLLISSAGFALARKRPAPTPAASTVTEPLPEVDDLIVTPPPPGLGRRRSGWHVPVRR